MISYEMAREIADSYNGRTNYVEEYDDAYVFFVRGARSFGGEDEPIAIMKEDGSALTFSMYIDEGGHRMIAEYDKR